MRAAAWLLLAVPYNPAAWCQAWGMQAQPDALQSLSMGMSQTPVGPAGAACESRHGCAPCTLECHAACMQKVPLLGCGSEHTCCLCVPQGALITSAFINYAPCLIAATADGINIAPSGVNVQPVGIFVNPEGRPQQ